MAKVTESQEKQIREALAAGKPLPSGVRINFGDPEPFQKAGDKPAETKDK